MAKLIVNPVFNTDMEALTPMTPGHCDCWNERYQQLLGNDEYMNMQIDELLVKNNCKEIIKTLNAGQDIIIFSDIRISADSTIDIYTSVYGVSPKQVEVTDDSITMTFKAQADDVQVKVVVK